MKIITRHKGLIEWLDNQGINGEVIPHATPKDIMGQDVVGILPLHLAVLCRSVTVPTYECPLELRGQELSCDQLKELGCGLKTFRVFSEVEYDRIDSALTEAGQYISIKEFEA